MAADSSNFDPARDAKLGHDHYLEQGGGVALVKGHTAGALLPVAVARANPEQIDVLGKIQERALTIRVAAEEIDELVEMARQAGCSWSQIGWSVGTTPQAARKRFRTEADA